MKETSLDITDFESNRYVLIETILKHRGESGCNRCQWMVALVGNDKLNAINEFNKPCLLKINIELNLLGGAIEILKKDHGFAEDTTYKPYMLYLVGAVLVYCETSQDTMED